MACASPTGRKSPLQTSNTRSSAPPTLSWQAHSPRPPSPPLSHLGDIVGVKEKLAGAATEIRGVQAPDPYTLVLTIDAPKAYFLSKRTSGPAYVVQRANVEKGAAWTEEPVGTGPYRLLRWQHNQHMVLASNPDYYGGEPGIRTVNIYMGTNASGQLGQYESGGSLDVASVSVDDLDRVTDRNNPISRELQSVPDLSVTYLGFNLRQKPFDDPKVREALARAVDRQKIARVMFQSRVRAALGFVPPDLGAYPSPARDDLYNVSRARQLLSELSYRGADNLPRLRLYTAGDAVGPTLREVYSQTLGLDVEVIEMEWADFLEGLDKGEYPMFVTSWGADFPDPESFLGSLFRSDSPGNFTGYRNADVDFGPQPGGERDGRGEAHGDLRAGRGSRPGRLSRHAHLPLDHLHARQALRQRPHRHPHGPPEPARCEDRGVISSCWLLAAGCW